jgi:hypothetical protein
MDAFSAYNDRPKRDAASGDYAWLIELRSRLMVAVEIGDPKGQLPLPAQSTDLSQRLRRWLSEDSTESVRAAAERSSQTGDVVFINAEGLRVAVFAMSHAGAAALVAAEAAGDRPEDERRRYLHALITWLVPGEGLPGADEVASVQDWRELKILEQLLAQVASAGEEREVVRAFVEAISVWHDVDARGYVADVNGRLALDVCLPGADHAIAPTTMPPELRDWPAAMHMTARDAAEWGFAGTNNVVVVKLAGLGVTPRVIAFIGALQPHEEVRLSIYADLLRRALQSAADIESSRLIWALMQRLVANHESSEDALCDAATELSHSAVCTATVTVRRGDGVKVVDVEPTDDRVDEVPEREALSFPLPLTAPFSGTLRLSRPPGHPFTARERRLGEVATSILASWLTAALGSGLLYRDRRTLVGDFDDLIARGAGRATQEGADLSVVVFRPVLKDEPEPVKRQAWVGEIRRQLRPFDVAGMLATGEIGVLLPNTPADRARAVAERLQRSFASNAEFSALSAAAFGIASRGTAGTADHDLVDRARERASLPAR